MKKFHLLILLVAVTLFGCRTRSSVAPLTYNVTGIGDVTVTSTAPGVLTVKFTKLTAVATNESLNLSVTGLPSGITAVINSTPAVPPFTATITFTDNGAVAGTYGVNLIVTSNISGEKSYPFVLTVSGNTNINCDIAGTYANSTAACTANGSYNYAETIMNDSVASIGNKVIFMNFANFGYSVYGFVDCSTNTISIPSQSLPNFLTVSGSGSFTSTDSMKAVTVSYTTMTLDSMVSNCQFTLIQ